MGLMSAVSDAVLAAGGEVTGVIPRFMVEQRVASYWIDQACRSGKHARAQENDGRFERCCDCVARWLRHFGRVARNHHLETTRDLYLNPVVILNVKGIF